MINWMYFPQNKQIEPHLKKIINVFEEKQDLFENKEFGKNYCSDEILSFVSDGLQKIGYLVETSKKKDDKIRVPVLFGQNGTVDHAYEVDAYSKELKTVIEVEAGRAVVNYQFLKDFYEACLMIDTDYFCIAVKNEYSYKGGRSKDFEIVCKFFEALYASRRVEIPLKGILVIGYGNTH